MSAPATPFGSAAIQAIIPHRDPFLLVDEIVELVPGERIQYNDRFDDPNLPGEMTTTITLRAVSCGTELQVVQEGLPEMIPVEQCYLGWQESLVLLGKLVGVEIPD